MLLSLAFGAKAITAAQTTDYLMHKTSSKFLTKEIEWRFSVTPECSRGIFKTKYLLNGLKKSGSHIRSLSISPRFNLAHTTHMLVNTYVCAFRGCQRIEAVSFYETR